MEVLVNTIAQWDKKECLKFFIQWSKNRPNLKDFQTGCLRNNFATTTTTKFQFGVFKQVSTKFLRRRSFTLWSREDLHKCQVLAFVVFFGFWGGVLSMASDGDEEWHSSSIIFTSSTDLLYLNGKRAHEGKTVLKASLFCSSDCTVAVSQCRHLRFYSRRRCLWKNHHRRWHADQKKGMQGARKAVLDLDWGIHFVDQNMDACKLL